MPKKLRHTRWLLPVSAVLLVFLIIAFGKEYVGNMQIEREIAQLQDQKNSLETRKLFTLDLIDELSSEYYLEQEGREKQGLAREGETLVVINDDKNDLLSSATVQVSGLLGTDNTIGWFYYFFAPAQFETQKSAL